MKKVLALIIPLIVAALLFAGFRFISSSETSTAALQVTGMPQAEVFLDKDSLGKTPLYNDKLKPGEYTLKLVPQDSPGFFNFEGKVTLRSGILTVVDRIFKPTEAESEISIISLEKASSKDASEIAIVSTPDSAEVKLDEQAQGITPILLKDLSISDHQISISKNGYSSKTLRVRSVQGYKVTTSVKLSIAKTQEEKVTPTPSPAKEASESAMIRILDTPTGFLRVRAQPSTTSKELTRVNPGDTFPLLEEQEEWYKIRLSDGKEGWISIQYATRSR